MKKFLALALLAGAFAAPYAYSTARNDLSGEALELVRDIEETREKVVRYNKDPLRRGIYINELVLLCARAQEKGIGSCKVTVEKIEDQ